MSKSPNAPQHIIDLLEEGIQATRMKSAGFLPPGRIASVGTVEGEAYTEEIREATRIYRDTWVESPLLVALAYLKGDIDARQAKNLWWSSIGRIDDDIRNPLTTLWPLGRDDDAPTDDQIADCVAQDPTAYDPRED